MKNSIRAASESCQSGQAIPQATLYQQIGPASSGKAFRQFLNQTGAEDLLLNFFRQKGFDYATAEDLRQESLTAFFIKLQAGRFEYRGEGCLLSYLFGITKKQCLKAWRSQFRHSCRIVALENANAPTVASSDSDDFAEAGEVSLQEQAMMLAFRQMDGRSQRLLWGYVVEEESYESLASELGLKTSLVAKQQAYRKRIELRKATERLLKAA